MFGGMFGGMFVKFNRGDCGIEHSAGLFASMSLLSEGDGKI